MAASANALYVVRLVLGARLPSLPRSLHTSARFATRRFSTAALSQQADSPSTLSSATPTSAVGTASDAAAATELDFLEPESNEYEEAEEFLPARTSTEPAPIPWPTVFPHGEVQSPKSKKPCDLLARLVAENKLEQARKVHDELKELHIVPVYRKVYLKAALRSLQPTAQGRADFLFWLDLYPNRPATVNHPQFRATWEPVVATILSEHLDLEFIGKFIDLAARKGLLPAVMRQFIHVLAVLAPPRVSEDLMQRAMNGYTDVTTSKKSESRRAQYYRGLVSEQVNDWWNLYLRSLATAGWTDAARALLYSPPPGIVWDSFTRNIALAAPGPRKLQALEQRRVKSMESPMSAMENFKRSPAYLEEPLSKLVNQALRAPLLPDVDMLAYVQRSLAAMPERSRLLERFRHRFTNPPSTHKDRQLPTMAQVWWWHAEITSLRRAGKHKDVLEKFREHFLWLGLPPMGNEHVEPSMTRLVPTSKVITTIIPSLLRQIPTAEWAKFHAAYLDMMPTTAPTLHPTEYTHLAFVREFAFHLGPAGAKAALSRIMERDLDPGLPSWNAFILALAGRGRFEAALHVLEGMEAGKMMAGRPLPSPNYRTYMGLVRLCSSNGQEEWTRKFLERLSLFHKENTLEDVPEKEQPRRKRRHSTPRPATRRPSPAAPSLSQSS